MVKQIYFKDKQKTAYIVARFGKWIASYNTGEIKDKIYVLPSLSLYFNYCEFFIHFGFLNFVFHLWYKNYKKYDEIILKYNGETK